MSMSRCEHDDLGVTIPFGTHMDFRAETTVAPLDGHTAHSAPLLHNLAFSLLLVPAAYASTKAQLFTTNSKTSAN
jgi:hypothetical protein